MAKPGLMVALGIGKPKGASSPGKPPAAPESEPEMETGGDDFDTAAQNAFDAVSEGDADGFKLAFKAAVMACMDSDL